MIFGTTAAVSPGSPDGGAQLHGRTADGGTRTTGGAGDDLTAGTSAPAVDAEADAAPARGPGEEDARLTVSVVIPCHNCTAVLPEQLDALLGQAWQDGDEVLIADNGSTDDLHAIVAGYQDRLPGLRIVDASARRGPAFARNTGAEQARGEAVLFCDADDVVDAGWLAAMRRALAAHEFVAAALDRRRLNPPWTRRNGADRSELSDSNPPFLPYAFSAVMGVRRATHVAAGGFDESFADSCEDRDYCYRLQLAGTPLVLAPGAVVHYRVRDSYRSIFSNARRYARGNVQLYRRYRSRGLRKHGTAHSLASWLTLLPKLMRTRGKRAELAKWCYQLGWLIGRLEGSVKHRVWAV